MTGRPLTDRYHVSPQITPEDIDALKTAGYTTIICNRPDAEVPPPLRAASIGAAATAAGLAFEVLELTHQTMTPENVAKQAALVDASDGPVFAYCASGTRCSVIWALSQAGLLPTEEILAKAGAAGYDLRGMAPTLDALADAKG